MTAPSWLVSPAPMSAETSAWVKNEAPSASDSCELSPAALDESMATPRAPTGKPTSISNAGPRVPPLTRVMVPERQASRMRMRAVAAEPVTRSRSSFMGRRVPSRCRASASAWPE